MKRPNRARYEFGPFRIDEDERLLRRGSDVIPLSPKAIDTLLVLVESSGTAVGKGELLTRVWPKTFPCCARCLAMRQRRRTSKRSRNGATCLLRRSRRPLPSHPTGCQL